MIRLKNKDIFMTNYTKIITQYLYKQFSGEIMSKLLPAYIIHQISIICYLYYAEGLRLHGYVGGENKLVIDNDSEFKSDIIYLQRMKQIFCVICLAINFVNLYFFIRQTHHLGILSVLKLLRLWSFVDLIIIIVNFIIGWGIFRNDNPNVLYKSGTPTFVSNMRVIEAFGIMFMWFKSLYYLQLIPRIAPLIDIIFVILRDMKHFLLIFLISTISFIQTYYILGRN
jgi:hypothetical protein